MHITLTEAFEKHFSKVKFDSKLAKAIYGYQLGYVNSNREHLDFFGSNLLGVHVVRFKDSDVARLFDDILDVDFVGLSNSIKHVPSINQDFKISSDTFNLTIMYLIHKFFTSPIINDVQRKRAVYDCALIFFYRTIAALMSDRFRYPADPKIAQAAYANLSYKYLIKKLGSWHKVMDYRANDLTSHEGIHYKELVAFKNDLAIVYVINDSQGRLRDLFKNYYGEFIKVHSEGSSIGVTSGTYMDAEGVETVKEKVKSTEAYVNYIKNIITDGHSFIKEDLVMVIARNNSNTSARMIKSVLNWMSDSYSDTKYVKEIDEFVSSAIIHSFYMLETADRNINYKNYPKVLATLKNLYLSTRSTDNDLVRVRELGEKIVAYSQDKEGLSASLIMSTRTSVILYLMLRTLSGYNG